MLRIETKATDEKELFEAKQKLVAALQEVAADGLAPMVTQVIDDPVNPKWGQRRYFLQVSF